MKKEGVKFVAREGAKPFVDLEDEGDRPFFVETESEVLKGLRELLINNPTNEVWQVAKEAVDVRVEGAEELRQNAERHSGGTEVAREGVWKCLEVDNGKKGMGFAFAHDDSEAEDTRPRKEVDSSFKGEIKDVFEWS